MTSAALRWGGLLGVLIVVALRLVTVAAPQIWFDVDPARFAGGFGGIGPDGSLWLDAALLLAAAAALFGEVLAGRSIEWRLLLLAALPVPIILWHGHDALGDLWRGATWCGGIAALVAVAHLARDRAMRQVLVAVLLATLAPLLVRGALQMTIEHQDTMAAYESNRDAFLRDKGWAPDSAAAQIYERRLAEPRPRGWFVTTNLFGTVMGVGLVVWLGLAVGAVRERLASGWIGVPILIAIVVGAGVGATGSKGAFGATVAGAVVLAVGVVALARNSRRGSWRVALPLALAGAALVAIVVRGTALPERFGGDLSLLFRWHYLAAAARMFAEAPLTGVGPDGFQAAYALVRDSRSPEEVVSAHNVAADWIATLGVAGLAWIAVAAWMALRAGRVGAVSAGESVTTPSKVISLRTALLTVAVVTGAGVMVGVLVEAETLDSFSLFARYAGAAAFALFAMIALHLLREIEDDLLDWSMAAGATVLLVHTQIEMTLFPPGAVTWGLCVLGVAGARHAAPTSDARPIAGLAGVAGAILLAGAVIVVGAVPASGQQKLMREAAGILQPIGVAWRWQATAMADSDGSMRRSAVTHIEAALGDLGMTTAEISAFGTNAGLYFTSVPAREAFGKVGQLLEGFEPPKRRQAAAKLVEAWERYPHDAAPLEAAANQLALAAHAGPRENRDAVLAEARSVIDRAVVAHGKASSIAFAATLHRAAAERSQERSDWDRAIDLARRLATMDPRGITPWKRLGDTMWSAGDTRDAAEAYTIALVNDANFELDPLKQLSKDDRAVLRHRIDAER